MWYDNGNYYFAPEAADVAILGDLEENSVLTGTYTYTHPDGTPEGISEYSWFTADDASGSNMQQLLTETNISISLTSSHIDKYIAFQVRPTDETGISGNSEMSAFYGPVLEDLSSMSNINSEFRIYPNPVGTSLSIEFFDAAAKVESISLSDITGKQIMKISEPTVNVIYFDMSEKPAGLYFVRIETTASIRFLKVIKE
jgi:hypothetical protein